MNYYMIFGLHIIHKWIPCIWLDIYVLIKILEIDGLEELNLRKYPQQIKQMVNDVHYYERQAGWYKCYGQNIKR